MALSRDQIAARLKDIRLRIGFTQAQVATQLDVHRPTISEIEAGRRAVTAEELFQLANVYGTSVGVILSEDLEARHAPELLALRSDESRRSDSVDLVPSICEESTASFLT